MKTCPICGFKKPLSDYHSYFSKSKGKVRIGNYCKPCARKSSNKRAKEHYQINVEEKLKYAKNYRIENAEKIKLERPKYKKKQIEQIQNCYVRELLISKNGISPDFINSNPDILAVKRNQLKIKRFIKKIKNGKE